MHAAPTTGHLSNPTIHTGQLSGTWFASARDAHGLAATFCHDSENAALAALHALLRTRRAIRSDMAARVDCAMAAADTLMGGEL